MIEQWKPVPGWEGSYEVSDHGHVRSLDRVVPYRDGRRRRRIGVTLKPRVGTHGYETVKIGGEERLVHNLVAEAFRGPRPDGNVARHLDDNRLNNLASNILWGTPSDNLNDAVRNGKHYWASLTACRQGHEYTPENTRTYRGRRVCRTCEAASGKESREKARKASPPVLCGETTTSGSPCKRHRPNPETPCYRHIAARNLAAAA